MLFSPYSSQEIDRLKKIAQQLRIDLVQMIAQAGSGHPAGSLGMTDIFTALYFQHLNHKPKQPDWAERDRVILSNGHICPILYASLARAGYFMLKKLDQLREINYELQGHPHYNLQLGIENTSGPLGQGLSQACGMALGLRMEQNPAHIFCLMSDGEQQEGQTWEAYMLGAKENLSNLTAIIDRNQIQIEGPTEQIMPLKDLKKKIQSFGWEVIEIDGHHFRHILNSLQKARKDNKPTAIIAHTIPGKGVSFMENNHQWHGQAPDKKHMQQALKELQQL